MSKVQTVVRTAIAKGVARAADDILTSTQRQDVGAVTANVLHEVAPIVDHLTNNEPWYQSRVTWGVIIAGAATILKPLLGELSISAEQTTDIVNALATAGQAVGFALTLYGRWRAKKPISA